MKNVGLPRVRWMEDVENNLQTLKMKRWRERTNKETNRYMPQKMTVCLGCGIAKV
jgi:hypothetical protein